MSSKTQKSQEKTMLRTLKGEVLKTPPLWLMRQAGRYLPEYKATRAEAGSFLELCDRPDLATEVTLQPIRRYGFDAAILFADILLIPRALGQKLWFETGEGPRLEPITEGAALAALNVDQVHKGLEPVYETVDLLSAALPPETTFIGFAGAPWTVATYMIAGRGTPDQAPAKKLAWEDPVLMGQLMEMLVEATSAYLLKQVETGAEVIQIFDTWAGGLPESLFDELVIKPTTQIVKNLKAVYPDLPVIGFPRGVGALAETYMKQTGVDAIGLDSGQSLTFAKEKLQPLGAVQGNLDPLLLIAGGEAMDREVDRIKQVLSHGPHIFNLGHGIRPETDPANVERLVKRVRDA